MATFDFTYRSAPDNGMRWTPSIVHEVNRSPSDALDEQTQHTKQARFWDFSQVRVHADPDAANSAAVLHADARTFGRHIAFAPGRYAPPSPELAAVAGLPSSRILRRACTCEEDAPCASCSAKGSEVRRAGRPSTNPQPGSSAPQSVHRALSKPGRRLTEQTAQTLGWILGIDPGSVIIHADGAAAESAADVAANAYTVSNHIVFGAGQFAPATSHGRRLLAHELVHVAQDGGACANIGGALTIGDPHSPEECDAERIASNQRSSRDNHTPTAPSIAVVRRDPQKDPLPAPTVAPALPARAAPTQAVFHLVVRDRAIDLGGGTLVQDLEAAKPTLLGRRVSDGWTLVLSIHSSDRDVVAAQSGPDWQKNAKFYDAAKINSLFNGDAAFVKWRDQFGPTHVVLYGCQVNASFEQVIADNLSRGGKGQKASGLGPGCKPLSTAKSFGAKTRSEFARLSADDKAEMTREVQNENRTFGYYGGPPVPDDKVLDYLFDGPGKGEWASVEVEINGSIPNPRVPYWNRTSNHTFLQSCDPVNPLRKGHTPSAPP
jgi:Domain of unknown function (DUF4157)